MQPRQVECFPHQGSSRQSEKETPSLGTQVVHVCSCKEENHKFPQVGIWTFRHTAQRHLECVCYDTNQLATIIVWYQFVFFSGAAHLMVIKTFP